MCNVFIQTLISDETNINTNSVFTKNWNVTRGSKIVQKFNWYQIFVPWMVQYIYFVLHTSLLVTYD